MLAERLQRIATGLEVLSRRDQGFVVFGSESHRHRLRPPLRDGEVEAFERGRLRAAEQGLALRPFARDREALEREKAEAERALARRGRP